MQYNKLVLSVVYAVMNVYLAGEPPVVGRE